MDNGCGNHPGVIINTRNPQAGRLILLMLVKPGVNYRDLIKAGALVVDVRTQNEYQTGHVHGSINIPLDNFENGLSGLETEHCIITCCASGMRSAHAKNILTSKGFKEVYNAGSWRSLNHKIS